MKLLLDFYLENKPSQNFQDNILHRSETISDGLSEQ